MTCKDKQRQSDLETHYSNLYTTSVAKIKNEDYQIDDMLQQPELDKRLGITLIARIKNAPKKAIESFLLKVKEIEPNQYYYLNDDLHITVMPLITSHVDFNLLEVPVDDYVKLIEESLDDIPPYNVVFKGITASPSCIMVKGFLEDDSLDRLRNNMRRTFKGSKLENTLDDRYPLITAHTTVVRFKEKLEDVQALLQLLEMFENTEFGALEVAALELTCNNWYHSISDTLHKFDLRKTKTN